jgi:hypothetical protein
MKEEIKLLDFIRSTRFILYVAIATVIALSPNSYFVYHKYCVYLSPFREIFSGLVALIVAASITIFTVRKNLKVALYFAYFEITVSAYYYIIQEGIGWGMVPMFGFCIMLPYSVARYAQEIDVPMDSEPPDINDKWEGVIKDKIESAVNDYMDSNPKKKPSSLFEG